MSARVLGGILLATGILVAAASGLCSVAMLGDMGGGGGEGLPLVLLFGGLPFAVGVVMFLGGRKLLELADREPGAREDDSRID